MRISQALKQYHEEIFSDGFLQQEGRTVTNETVDKLAEMFVTLSEKCAQLRIEYAIMTANANERLETIEKLVSKIMEKLTQTPTRILMLGLDAAGKTTVL